MNAAHNQKAGADVRIRALIAEGECRDLETPMPCAAEVHAAAEHDQRRAEAERRAQADRVAAAFRAHAMLRRLYRQFVLPEDRHDAERIFAAMDKASDEWRAAWPK